MTFAGRLRFGSEESRRNGEVESETERLLPSKGVGSAPHPMRTQSVASGALNNVGAPLTTKPEEERALRSQLRVPIRPNSRCKYRERHAHASALSPDWAVGHQRL